MSLAGTDSLSLHGLVERARRGLKRAGIVQADLDARVLACAAAGAQHADLIGNGDAAVDGATVAALDRFVDRRVAREPVSRILGYREFWSLRFDVDRSTLDPRADSETVIEAVLALPGGAQDEDRFRRICDLGTGSGCLLVALLCQFEAASGVGVDVCADALRMARRNARAHGLDGRAVFICGDWTMPLAGGYDLIVSNPPYIRSGEIAGLPPEVRCHDPLRALDGGADGLDAYRRVIAGARTVIVPGGWLVVEVGAGQAGDVARLMRTEGFRLDEAAPSLVRDTAGIERCVRAQA